MLIPDLDFSFKSKQSFKDAIDYSFKEKYIKIDGVKICYTDEGKGLPILFIHGLGGNLLHYKMNIPYFKANHRVIALDLPGYGKSDKPKLDDAIPYYVKLIKKFIDKLNINEVILAGNSMGGHISCIFAAKYKKSTKGLILIDSAGLNELNILEDFFISNLFSETFLTNTPSFIMETTLKHNFYHARDEVEEILQAQKAMVGATDYEDYCHALEMCAKSMKNNPLDLITKEIICPTIIFWGKNDRLIDVRHADLFHQSIAGSELVIFDYCGHISMLEKHEEFNKDTSDFIAKKKIEKTSLLKKIFKK